MPTSHAGAPIVAPITTPITTPIVKRFRNAPVSAVRLSGKCSGIIDAADGAP